MLDLADEINQKRGIALIKVNGREVFYDQDYFGYDDFQAIKVEREKLKKVSDLFKEDVDRILLDSKWKDEKYFISIRCYT